MPYFRCKFTGYKRGIIDVHIPRNQLLRSKCYHKYKLLNSGSALGDSCGPLFIKRPETILNSNSSIAIPGELTTANLLFKIAYPAFTNKTPVLFSEIEDLVCSGKFDAGLIIHENRFTFQKKGLVKVEDLGDFWFNNTNLPIPLGGIAISRNFSQQEQKKIDRLILNSLKFSLSNKGSASKYVKAYAQEMDPKVIQSHINLYVNDFSVDLGLRGRSAIKKVFEELENNFQIEQSEFEVEEVSGHFNNPILLISSKLKRKTAQNFISLFFSKMKKEEFEDVFNYVEDYVTSSGLNLRISKQKLMSGILALSREDTIKINISTPVYVKNETKKIYQELMRK